MGHGKHSVLYVPRRRTDEPREPRIICKHCYEVPGRPKCEVCGFERADTIERSAGLGQSLMNVGSYADAPEY